ncbi:D-beta-hydroxybutyrate dehydrogenase, mitochondrial-like [Haliotis rufescens]|uniref:D-beta-hydroxybutyrate dehydrogenase, mitochondrial-like n=1 Tax=Haliotis rufescens TaxID=6454 RepID=UPI00201F5C0B|nr:D-beta-hydroxybutyrate dehydrogenase, mitochondrial-like [Haliotis rufescens]
MAPPAKVYLQYIPVAATAVFTALVYYFIDYILWCIVTGCVLYAAGVYFLKSEAPSQIDPTGKAILITGCDAGLGNELATRAHKLGFTVFAGCLNDNTEGSRALQATFEERMHVLKMDVTKDGEVTEALKYVQERCRSTGLWAVVNNAGIDGGGPVELCSMKFYKDVCEVNLFGAIRVSKAFLPLVRQAKGRVINVSSERGRLARGGNSTYCISKYGLEAFSDALRHEMRRFGVQVSLTEPGHFGGATAILLEHNVEMFRKRLFDGFNSASDDVRKVYPQEVAEQAVKDKYISSKHSPKSCDIVLDVMERQLIEVKVSPRYLIGGTNSVVDLRVVYIFLKSFLPDQVMDYLLEKIPV